MSALSRKVLVIDDDPVVGCSFDRVLAAGGYQVSTALDGTEALERIVREDYDVVFTDIKMPGIDGLEVARRIRKERPWVPVVIITGYGSPDNRASAAAAGVADFLDKPLSPDSIERSTRAAFQVIEGGRPQSAVVTGTEPASAATASPATPPAPEATVATGGAAMMKSLGMMLAVPFIGLAYILALPFLVAGAVAWPLSRMTFRATAPFFRNAALFLAAPFIGLAYIVAFPFIGAAMLVWRATKALKTKQPAAK